MGIRKSCAWGLREAHERKGDATMVAAEEQRTGKQ
jgi:hypothetical protein